MGSNFLDSLSDIQKRRLFNGVLAVVVLLAIFLGIKSIHALKETSSIGRGIYPTNTINVTGMGEVFAVPDTASFSFTVMEEGKTVADAQEKATKKMNAILDAVKEMGIEDKDVKTIGYYSNPKYEYSNSVCPASRDVSGAFYCPPGKQVLTGYEVSQTILIKVRKTDEAGDVLTKVGTLGASNISGLSFVTDDMDAVQAEARDLAIEDAKEKAEILAKSLGVKLVKIVSFNESGGYPQPYMYGMGAMEAKAVNMDSSVSVAPQLPVGENQVVSNISITYEVR